MRERSHKRYNNPLKIVIDKLMREKRSHGNDCNIPYMMKLGSTANQVAISTYSSQLMYLVKSDSPASKYT